MKLKEILKFIGAGVTGGLLAARLLGRRKTLADYPQVFDALSVEFISHFQGLLLNTMLPEVNSTHRKELDGLLDRPANFNETLRFLQQVLPDFDALTIKALHRFCRYRSEDVIFSTSRRRISEVSGETFQSVVNHLFLTLDTSFHDAMEVNAPEGARGDPLFVPDSGMTMAERLEEYRTRYPNVAAVLFDAIAQFEERLKLPG